MGYFVIWLFVLGIAGVVSYFKIRSLYLDYQFFKSQGKTFVEWLELRFL